MIILSLILLCIVFANAYFLNEYISQRDKQSKIENICCLFAIISCFLAGFYLAKIVYGLPPIDVKIQINEK